MGNNSSNRWHPSEVTVGSLPGLSLGKEFELTNHARGIQNGSRFTKAIYQIQEKDVDSSFMFPDSAMIRYHDCICRKKATILMCGFVRSYKADLRASDIQSVLVSYYCIETIEIYMQKTFESLGNQSQCSRLMAPMGIHLHHDKLGISHTKNIERNEIVFGTFGEERFLNNTRAVRSVFVIPCCTKYRKGKSWSYPYVPSADEQRSRVPFLNGPNSISVMTGPEAQREYKMEKEQPQIMQQRFNYIRQGLVQAAQLNGEQFPYVVMDSYVRNYKKQFEERDPSRWTPLVEQPDCSHFVKKEIERTFEEGQKEELSYFDKFIKKLQA